MLKYHHKNNKVKISGRKIQANTCSKIRELMVDWKTSKNDA